MAPPPDLGGRPAGTGMIARARNALTDGPHHTAADRELAARIAARWPCSRDILGHARAFHSKVLWHAVTAPWNPARGLLIAAAGYPMEPDPHTAALDAVPYARAAYADPDPEVVAVNRGMLGGRRVSAYQGVVRDPAALLAAPEAMALPRPLCVLLRHVLQFHPADAAADLIAEYARLLPPHSMLAVSVAILDEDGARDFNGLLDEAGTGLRAYAHTPGDITAWMEKAGFDVAEPGVVDVARWPLCEAGREPAPGGWIAGALARVREPGT